MKHASVSGWLYPTAAVFCLAALGSCELVPEIQTEYNRDVRFDTLKSFSWLDADVSYMNARDREMAFSIEANVRKSVIASLEAKGCELVETDTPDFFVTYHFVLTYEEDPFLTEHKWVFGGDREIYYENRTTGGKSIQRGTLIILVVDGTTRHLLWQGTMSGKAVSSWQTRRQVDIAVRAMLETFPPNPDDG